MEISILGVGWLGLPLAQRLSSAGHLVKGSTTTNTKLEVLQKVGIEPYLIQLNGNDKLESDFFQSDILIITVPPGRRNPDVFDLHTSRMRQVIAALDRVSLKGVIYTSSTSVYGDAEGEVTEADPVRPVTDSGKAVLATEKMLTEQPFSATMLRFGGLAGDDRPPGRFFAGRKGIPNGNAPVNFVRQEDCIGAIMKVLEKNIQEDIYNVVATEHPLKKDFYPAQALKLGLEPPQFTEEKTQAYKVVSNKKIREQLGYQFLYPNPMDF